MDSNGYVGLRLVIRLSFHELCAKFVMVSNMFITCVCVITVGTGDSTSLSEDTILTGRYSV